MPLNTAAVKPVIEVLHGVTVTDRFRWLEDRTSEATSAWIAGQQLRHDAYFAQIRGLDALRGRVAEFLNVETVDQPVAVAGRIFYRCRKRDQEQACICVKGVGDDQERVLVDPSALGPFASVGIYRVSCDGALLAYGLRRGGADAMEIHFVHTASGRCLWDSLPVGYSRGLLFTPDGRGFVYVHEDPSRSEDHTIRLHVFGCPTNDTVLFRHRRTPSSRLALLGDEFRLGAVCADEKDNRIRTHLYCAEYDQHSEWRPVFVNKLAPYEPFLYQSRIFALTDEDAPNGKLIELSSNGTELGVVVPQSASRIERYTFIGEAVYVQVAVDRKSVVRVYGLDGSYTEATPLPTDGTVQLLPRMTSHPDCLFYTYESFDTPLTVYEYQTESRTSRVVSKGSNPCGAYPVQVDQVGYTSFDGTDGVPGKFRTSGSETNWYGRSMKWARPGSTRLNKL